MSRGLRSRLTWPLPLDGVWLTLPFVAILARIGLQPNPPHDYWWPIVHGRELARTSERVMSNTFLYTLDANLPFFNQPWLAEWLLYQGHMLGGALGLTWLHALIVCATFGLNLDLGLRMGAGTRAAVVACTVATLFGSLNMAIRTQMFAYPCFMLVCYATLMLAREGARARWGAVSLVGALVWANVHGSFPLATLLTGAGAVGWLWSQRASERSVLARGLTGWSALVAAVALVGCVHPSGWLNYAYVYTMTTTFDGSSVSEWAPMATDEAAGIAFYVAAALSALMTWRARARPAAVLMLLGCMVLAVDSRRSLMWWALTLAPALAPIWPERPREDDDAPTRNEGIVNAALALALLGSAALVLPGAPLHSLLAPTRGEEPGDVMYEDPRDPNSRVHASATLALLAREGAPGRIFHDQALGGQLEWYMGEGGEQVAFVDQRFELTPDALWDEYFLIAKAKPGWERALACRGVRTAIVNALETPELRARLGEHPRWSERTREWPYVTFVREPYAPEEQVDCTRHTIDGVRE